MRLTPKELVPTLRMSQVVGSLSYALDLTEGQPQGHAARSCMIGMRLAQEVKLPREQWPALFYALLLKDLGCSSNASKVCYLFDADDRKAKCNLKTVDWSSFLPSAKYLADNVAPGASFMRRARQFLSVAAKGPGQACELVQLRCDRGASIARNLCLPEETASAIRSLDEHWDGRGFPDHLKGDQIPLLARFLNLAQTVEVFWALHGVNAAQEIVMRRSGSWFDPELAEAMRLVFRDETFWRRLASSDPAGAAGEFEPEDRLLEPDDATLDRVATGFGQVIDAKSPWTFCHSSGVADIATGIGNVLGFSPQLQTQLRRAALLHDIGKLAVSNLILDKRGKLTPDELAVVRQHPKYTQQILSRVDGFRQFAEIAASHHEKLDGSGYHRGLHADALGLPARTLVVADMYEALAARRPYRQELSEGEVMGILERDAGKGICPHVLSALKTFLNQSHFVPYQIAA